MLVLTRRVGQEIVIADDIRVTVLSVRGETVRLGIQAPEFVRIDRQEVHERRCAEEEAVHGAHINESLMAVGAGNGHCAL